MSSRPHVYLDVSPHGSEGGFGLGCSTFQYSGMKLSTKEVAAGGPLGIDVDVANTSQV